MATEATKIPFVEAAAPSTPAASRVVVYAKSDGLMYSKDDAGTETLMSGGAGGGSVATDAIFDAKGDLPVGTGANTAAKLTVGANGTRPEAASGESTGIKWSLPPGYEFDYAEFTSPVTISATAEATPTNVVVGNSVAYDGSTIVLIEFFAPWINDAGTGDFVELFLYDGTTSLGAIWQMELLGSGILNSAYVARRLTPSNASHTYKIGGIRGSSNGTVTAGAGGSGNVMPGFIRITKV